MVNYRVDRLSVNYLIMELTLLGKNLSLSVRNRAVKDESRPSACPVPFSSRLLLHRDMHDQKRGHAAAWQVGEMSCAGMAESSACARPLRPSQTHRASMADWSSSQTENQCTMHDKIDVNRDKAGLDTPRAQLTQRRRSTRGRVLR